ncbi:TetR/AcrR family transcriptional regulator [Mycolicibacterium smegmatis]|jgi:AcrR family transcriptional regulator|uniref:Transcriptional regulator n=4 Tax=Bacteria TaxID=2 RepID=A0QZB2_MYCS2|nr:TetR/AcrR family transcriptional regulator [Mycolicibacterium smegmatis]ABK71595.1 transcriptional regulator [Mycolicibacterium smegmatis MC2 155]AFP40327.1 TetR-type regulator [Mycolicibacterium smegmatis MC2 155]AIU09074.1 transcriptional regulator [Mycolicibacterium smegmatis MC2 155]AIU15699.1 transcriptional regulator [Mycolicibacterium smegmatis]AIU22322.1 transcriptional regulator [Mycolicibacterium smegmatis]
MALCSTTAPVDLRSDGKRNRDRILEVARHHIAERRLELPMNVIAREAGVGVGTVYRHFPTRQSLLETVAADGFGEITTISRRAAHEPDPAKSLRKLLGGSVKCLHRYPGLAPVLESQTFACSETVEMAASVGRSVEAVLKKARKAGLVRAGVSGDDLRWLILGVHHAASINIAGSGRHTRYLTIVMDGLRRPAVADR